MEPEHAAPARVPPHSRVPPPAPSEPGVVHVYRSDLAQVRALVLRQARAAGLAESRANDLVLAVSEAAANTLRHTAAPGTLTIWHDRAEIVCEIRDSGQITDSLAGQRRPGPDADGGHGLWLVHQVCDLVELRSDKAGTTIRMHMALGRPGVAGDPAADEQPTAGS